MSNTNIKINQNQSENRLNLVQPQVDNNQTGKIPVKTIKNKQNILNNRLILKPNKQIVIDPQNKEKLLKNKPTNYIYDDVVYRVSPNDLYFDPEYYYTRHDLRYRFPYWKPLWQQYYDPYIRVSDIPLIVPISDNKIANIDANNSIDKNSSKLKTRSTSQSSYASFSEPIPIFVQRKQNLNKNNAIDIKEDFRMISSSGSHTSGSRTSGGHKRGTNRAFNHHNRNHHRRTSGNWTGWGGSNGGYWGPYLYYPFYDYYYYDPNIILPYDLDSAILPINIENNEPIINNTDVKLKENEKSKETKEKFTERFTKKLKIPDGYKVIQARLIEIFEKPKSKTPSILFLILIFVLIMLAINKTKIKKYLDY